MDRIRESGENFPEIFKNEYANIRKQAEANVREYVKKSVGDFEITFNSIFDRIRDVYSLSAKQTALLKKWEIVAELDNVIPLRDKLDLAEQLVCDGEQVVLVSDMYLPKSIIFKMIQRVSTVLSKVPIFISSDAGVQKSARLYLDVYLYFQPYTFREWHHYGDNKFSDGEMAKNFGIFPHIHEIPHFNSYEKTFISYCNNYDSYLIAGLFARVRFSHKLNDKEYFAFAHVGCYLVPYIAWVIRDALNRSFETLYFVSRDGYFLKIIADEYIKLHKINIKTKYIYGSRRAWRLSSQISDVDDEFFSNFGEFTGVDNYQKLLSALHMSHHIFRKLFPELNFSVKSTFDSEKLTQLRSYFKNSDKCRQHILQSSTLERKITTKYLLQEIDFSENFAFVEFWARGYTQSSLHKILVSINPHYKQCHCYYFRSILPSQGNNIRYNFSTNNTSLIFIESIFANHPYSSIYGYREEDGFICPVRDNNEFDADLFIKIKKYLKIFIHDFYSLKFIKDVPTVEKICSDVSLYWYRDHQDDPVLVNSLGHLLYNGSIWGAPREFAPPFTATEIMLLRQGKPPSSLTNSVKMSLARSSPKIISQFKVLSSRRNRVQVGLNHSLNHKTRLVHKLKTNPELFFADSQKRYVRLLGRFCFSPLFRHFLGRSLIFLTKRIISKR